MEVVAGADRVEEVFNFAESRVIAAGLLQVLAAAERVKKVFAKVKILLEGCVPAQEQIQFLSDQLYAAVNYSKTDAVYVRDEVATLVFFLCRCSDRLIDADSIEDVVRVEVTNRLLFSTLQNFTVPLDGLVHLEKLTEEQDHFNREVLAYGYRGITLTRTGSLQIETAQLMDSGKLALQNANLLEPLLVDDTIRHWFWGHFRRLAICFRNLKEYQGSIPWFEAALKVAKFESFQQVATSNFDLGSSLYNAALHSADTEKKEEWFGRGVTQLKNSIDLFETETLDGVMALSISMAHDLIGHWAYSERKDFSLSLQHFGKGVEIAATHSLHLQESQIALNYGAVLLETKPDKLGEVRASFRQCLEAVLKAISCTDLVPISLNVIHRATMYEREGVLCHIQTLPSEPVFFFPCGKPGGRLLSIRHEMWDSPTSWPVARARAHYILGCDYYYQTERDRAIAMMLSGLRILEAEPTTDLIGQCQSQSLLAAMYFKLGQMHFSSARYKEAAKIFHLCAQLPDLKDEVVVLEYEGNALVNCGDNVKALKIYKEILSQISTDADLSKRRVITLAMIGLIEYRNGDVQESILSLEQAKKTNEEDHSLDIPNLVVLHINLVQAYLKKHEYWAAFHLVKSFQPIIDEYHKGDSLWQIWQCIKTVGYLTVGDLRSADKTIEQTLNASESESVVFDGRNSRSIEWMTSMCQSALYRGQDDVDSALIKYNEMEEFIIKDSEGVSLEFTVPGNDYQILLKSKRNLLLGEIHLNRAAVLLHALDNEPNLRRACHESQQAALLLRKEEGQELLLARALACQAASMVNLSVLTGDHRGFEPKELIDEAIRLVETRDSLLLAKFRHVKATAFQFRKCDRLTAEAEGREAVLIFAAHQLQLRDMESAWVSMFGLDMRKLFTFMQDLSLYQLNMPIKALLWAERGRTRLFLYIVRKLGDSNVSNANRASDYDTTSSRLVDKHRDDLEHVQLQKNPGKVSCSKKKWLGETDREICDGFQLVNRSTSNLPHESVKDTYDNLWDTAEFSGLGELWFDKDDALAERYLFEAVEQCGPEALILEYTYEKEPGKEGLFIYAVFIAPGDRHVVEWENVDVQALIERLREGKKKWVWGRTLTALISKTREYIVKKADDEAMEGLSLLHSVLIKPVEKYVKACQRLILSIHEQLALVPFAALFNKQSGKFLVQEKTISYIPSIRVLHYCFHRQREFERQMQKGFLDTPFIAGNPEPMGWGMEPLPGAAEEAKLVAEMLGVGPCIGSDMTKKAVTAGLSKASMVLLATHGVVNTYFPHGALILQGCNSKREEESSSTALARISISGLRGHFFQRLRDSPNGNVNGSAAIISDELATLPSGIRAGLVVLSTCKSGEGEVTSEGLLGLGRALLQGGAPAAIVALWEVADSSNKVLIAGLFEQLVKHGKDAAEALRQIMLQMMGSKEKKYQIFHWAPLVVLGTPIFKYVQGPHSSGRNEA